ncbi:hypothetical protein EIN_026450 [Entamoeba invadens IP1]|uniref:hypothetical protein n=1 Tax=Entamoeba invadens IP1 TaxID=370355 RepID=UPI0002C3D6D7|nr:hypothetical protein EIN_026450 [Entamoeba invadens IP1]ELP90786.1 hypothetical protein EIN_026450 [Entamoeba invadens IP1]|eukprot:XP_004257557.1 hypothetical protein EIN_026450 [Entamoeba invadens IP1]
MASTHHKPAIPLKIIFIGESGVGKTAVIQKYVNNVFLSNTQSTLGVEFVPKVWDTAGQERFRSMTAGYYRGCHGIIVMFDVTNRDSFEAVKSWADAVGGSSQNALCKILVGNKIDINGQRKVEKEEGEKMAEQIGYMYLECSAALDKPVTQLFETLADSIIAKYNPKPLTQTETEKERVSIVPQQQAASSAVPKEQAGCC